MMRFFLFQEHEEDLLDLIHEKEVLEEKILQREQTIREWAQKFIEAIDKQKLIQTNYENLLQQQYKCQEKKKTSPQTTEYVCSSRFDPIVLYRTNAKCTGEKERWAIVE